MNARTQNVWEEYWSASSSHGNAREEQECCCKVIIHNIKLILFIRA